jgi:hypothetical protein
VGFSLDPGALFLELVLSGIGFVLLVYGKKQGRWPQLAAGAAYTIYPYFVGGVTAMLVVGALLGVGLWLLVHAGY